jgi:regulatory protein
MDTENTEPAGDVPRVSRDDLHRRALDYLERYAASSARVAEVLTRAVRRRHGSVTPAERVLVASVVERLQEIGLLDDARYAEARIRSLRDAGRSVQKAPLSLRAKGVDAAVIDGALAEDEADRGPDGEHQAARAFVRKRRFGAHGNPDTRAERRQKELAALLRAGFAYDVAREVLAEEPT